MIKRDYMKDWSWIKTLSKAIFSGIVLFSGYYSPAQLLSNNGQEIFIGKNILFTIQGGLQNNGTIVNSGEIVLKGDWENYGEYIAGEGTIVLTGSDQQFNHNQQDIYELVIEGGGEKHFVSGATITNNLYLTSGVITPSSDYRLMAGPSLTIWGGNNKSYINGTFYHQGAGDKLFPIGKNGHYSPVSLQVYGNPVVGYEVFESNKADYFAVELRKISSLQYWQQDLVAGHIEDGSTITLPMSIEEGQVTEEEIVIAGAIRDEGTYRLLETVGHTGMVNSGFVTSLLNPTFSLFAIGLLAESPEERSLFIPNAFAPFSLKANDDDSRVRVYGKSISDEGFLFRIYNRWGVVVYETYSYEEAKTVGWDGINRSTGKPETMGSYKYSLKGRFMSGKLIEKTGTIHLIR